MKYKKTNIKIRRSKVNLYNKRKNKKRKIITAVITAVCAVALCILGYGLGKPLVEYFTNKSASDEDSVSAWTPPDSESVKSTDSPSDGTETVPTSASSEPSASASGNNSGDTSHAAENGRVYFLSDDAALSSASLNSALAAAKDSGCSVVAVLMKNDTGKFLYKSEISGIKDTDFVTGALTAKQICDSITKAGFVPAAKISTLKDSSCGPTMGAGYELATGDGYWLDNAPTKGGKTWLSPFQTKTQQFVGEICEELSAAGFKQIIAVNTMYPAFHTVDISTYLSNLPLKDNSARITALWNVLDSAKAGAEKNGAELLIEISGEAIAAESRLCTDAELIGNTSKLAGAKIIVDYTPDASAADAYSSAKDFAAKLKTALKGADFAAAIHGVSSGSALTNIEKAFTEQNIDIVS